MSLADHVRTLGRGPGRARSLTLDEARDAMALMLCDAAAPEAVGALLMLLRMKGETAEEIAGFADAARAHARLPLRVDLDWPSYAAGRTRGLPWFLLSARLVAQAGHRVLLHGWNGGDATVRDGLAAAGIATARTADEAAALLDRDGIAYLPLEAAAPALFRLLSLRDVLGLRSCINTVCRMWNPCGAPASVQGVFHPSYRLLQADAAALLGWHALSVIKGGGGEFERTPAKDISLFGVRDGVRHDSTLPASLPEARRLSDTGSVAMRDLWSGAAEDGFARRIVVGTAELALHTLGHARPGETAETLWSNRHARRAA